jgi:hypothetical protein
LGRKLGFAQTPSWFSASKKGIPFRSVGSSRLRRRSKNSRSFASEICLTIEDFPIPGAPQIKTGSLRSIRLLMTFEILDDFIFYSPSKEAKLLFLPWLHVCYDHSSFESINDKLLSFT